MGIQPDTDTNERGGTGTGATRIDLPQARRLADLISLSVAQLEARSSSTPSPSASASQSEPEPESTERKTAHISKEEHEEHEEKSQRESVLTIASAATQLAALVRPPEQVVLEVATGFTLSAALRLAVEAHVPEVIRVLSAAPPPPPSPAPSSSKSQGLRERAREKDGEEDVFEERGEKNEEQEQKYEEQEEEEEEAGVPVSDIARLCGVHVAKLERILRLLATHHIFAERPSRPLRPPLSSNSNSNSNSDPNDASVHESLARGEARFAHTRLSAALDSGAALGDILDLPSPTPAPAPVGNDGKNKKIIGGGDDEDGSRSGRNGKREIEEEKEKETTSPKEEAVDEDEKRRERWAAKYGAEAPGAGLAALVGLLTDESMFHATALTDVLLDYRAPYAPASTSTSTSTSTPSPFSYPDPKSDAESPSLSSPSSPPSPDAAPAQDLIKNEDAPKVQDVSKNQDSSEGTDEGEDQDDPLRAPFSRARALPRTTMFEWLSAPGNAHRLHRFGCAMRGMGSLTPESAILRGFDFASLPRGSTVVDVGGGVGTASLPILRAYPHLKLVVQDTEEVVRVAPGFWESQYREALREGRVAFQVQSFFDAQPQYAKVDGETEVERRGPAVFLLRMIMHNWPDAHCVRILARLRAAAGPRTRLVLVDSVLMAACRERRDGSVNKEEQERDGLGEADGWRDAKVKEAPEPLLANWGTANGLAYRLDLIMLANHNAGERTLAAFAALLARTGWVIQEVHAASESWMPQIVAVPAPAPARTLSLDTALALPGSAPSVVLVKTEEREDRMAPLIEPELKVDHSEDVRAEMGSKSKEVETSPRLVGPPKELQTEEKDKEKAKKDEAKGKEARKGNGEGKKKRFSFLRRLLPARGH